MDLKDTFGLSPRIDRILDLFRMALCIVVLIVIAVGAWRIIPVVETMPRPATRLSTAWMFYPVLVGAILMILATALNACALLLGKYPLVEPDDAPQPVDSA